MKSITESEFYKLIETENKYIFFCFFNWSGYSVISKKIVENWETEFNREVMLIDCSNLDFENYYQDWLNKKEKDDWSKEGIMTIRKFSPRNRLHGYGEICWILNNEVVGFEAIYKNFNSETLEKRTEFLFN